MNLTDFPSEILTLMLSPSDSSFLCIRLWKTGDRLLQYRLTQAMVSLDLRPFRSQFQFPSIVSKLPRLRCFAITPRPTATTRPHKAIRMLEMLPRTLESLEFDFSGLISLLANSGLSSDATSTGLVKTHYPQGLSHLLGLHVFFPHLTSLTLGGNCLKSDGLGYISSSDLLPVLPSTLTELNAVKMDITSPFASMLPRSLIKLNCELHFRLTNPSLEHYEAAWFDAPPRLEYIKYLLLSGMPSTHSWLPKSITLIDSCWAQLNHSQDVYLPIKTLTLSQIPSYPTSNLVWTSRMLQTVTELNFVSCASLPLTQLGCLPSSLAILRSYITWTDQDLEDVKKLELTTLWPPALTHLELETRDLDIFVAVLPPTLEMFVMREHLDEPRMDLRALPPLVHTLTCPDPQMIDHWPSNVKSLTITSSTEFELWPTLPRSLTELKWHSSAWDLSEFDDLIIGDKSLLLPPQLTTLQLAKWRSDWIHLIPRTVTSLTISHLISSSEANGQPDHFLQLPTSLTKLHLSSDGSIELLPSSLAHLSNLIDLETNCVDLPSAAIVYLPRMMKSLSTSLTRVNPSDLGFLPLTLTRCNLGLAQAVLTSLSFGKVHSCRITSSDLLPVLPSTLTELITNNLTIYSVSFASLLPRSLIKLDCELCFQLPSPSLELYKAAWFDAPPHLEYLGRVIFPVLPFESSWLPISITLIGACSVCLSSPQDLHLPTNTLFISHLDFKAFPTLLWTSRLPPNLTDLTLKKPASLPLTHLHCLPSSLTRLRSIISWSRPDLEDAKKRDLSTLWPSALTHLGLQTRDFDVFMVLLPPTLEILDLSEQSFEQQVDLRALPPLLHTLTTADHRRIDHWPSSIKSLRITNFDPWPPLPSSLTKLTWCQIQKRRSAYDVSITVANLFPPRVTTAANLFPPQMTLLHLAEWRSEWFGFLPRTATSLTIDKLIAPYNAIDTPDHFLQLPNSLTKLNLSSETWIQLSLTSLAHLYNLIDLETHSIDFPSVAIFYLPRMMKSLQTSLTRVTPSDDAYTLQIGPRNDRI